MNLRKLMILMSLGQQEESYSLHCMKMCSCISMLASLHGHWYEELGKNLWQYSPMGACPSIMQMNLAQFKIPISGSHKPSLVYVGLITCSLLSSKSKKSCSFFLLSWNDVFHESSRLSHLFLLLSKNEFFLESMGVK